SSYRFSSMFEPNENVRWFLAYENFLNNGTGDVGSLDFDNRVNDATAPGNLDLDSDNLRTRLDIRFGEGYTLNTVFSSYDATQHELQITNPSDASFVWTGGLFFFEEDNGIRFDMLHGSWGFTPQDSPNGVLSTFVQPSRSLESQSAYFQGTFNLGDAFRLTAGARYIEDVREDQGGRSI